MEQIHASHPIDEASLQAPTPSEIKRPIFEFYGALHSIRTHVSGHGRIELDCNRDCLHVLQALQNLQLEKGATIVIAAVPLLEGEEIPIIRIEER